MTVNQGRRNCIIMPQNVIFWCTVGQLVTTHMQLKVRPHWLEVQRTSKCFSPKKPLEEIPSMFQAHYFPLAASRKRGLRNIETFSARLSVWRFKNAMYTLLICEVEFRTYVTPTGCYDSASQFLTFHGGILRHESGVFLSITLLLCSSLYHSRYSHGLNL